MTDIIRRNVHGNYEHLKTSLVFDPEEPTKGVIGKQNKNGQIDPLTKEDIVLCDKYKFEYLLPDDYNPNKMPRGKFDIETWFHATYEKGKNGTVQGFTYHYEDMLNIFLHSTLEEKEDGSLWVPAMRCVIPTDQVYKYSLRGPWDSHDFTVQERWRAWNEECMKQTEKNHKTLDKEVSELKDWVMEASKTMEVLMKEINSLRELVDKTSTVPENQQKLLTPLQLQKKS
jgi:hypothetical protein